MKLLWQDKWRALEKISTKVFSGIFFALMMVSLTSLLCAGESSAGRGLKAHTPEQLKQLEENSQWVIGIKHNKIGAARIKAHAAKSGKPAPQIEVAQSHEDEISTTTGYSANGLNQITANLQGTTLPSSVNNSLLPSFPPIGDQGQLGSCVAWGSTYYQASHEIGLLNGNNNKTSQANVLSPKWTYNLLNGGQDDGLMPNDAFSLLASNGAVSIVNFPYDTNYLAWDTNAQDWVSAISNRLAPAQLVAGLGGSQTQNLSAIKQLLNNGHVVNFATYVDSWVYATVGNNPSSPNDHVGEMAVSWMNGTDGGHFLTIVGYDDNVWIDINGNGKVDSGETGAFLIANSWSNTWGNSGFVWIAYDAFRSVSAVSKGPSSGRVAVGDAMNSMAISALPIKANYSPSLVANFTLSQSVRDQILLEAGISATSSSNPTTTLTDYALNNQGGSYQFNGTLGGAAESATFAFDLTDFLASVNSSTAMRYYINILDSSSSNPTELTSFTLLDTVHGQTGSCTQVPLACNPTSLTAFINYEFAAGNTVDTTPPVVNITSPLNNATLSGTANITVSATDNVAVQRVEFYVDSQLQATDTTNPYYFTLNTTQLSNGTHTLMAIAYDTSNNQAQSSITVTVQNQQLSSTAYINSGGNKVTYQNVTWQQDFGFGTPSSTTSTTLRFSNPIYQTARTGSSAFSYQIPITNGSHNVTLKFAEFTYNQKGKRVFSVSINGSQVISNLDLVKTAGFGKTYDKTFQVNVVNNSIQITFTPVTGNPQVNGIQIN